MPLNKTLAPALLAALATLALAALASPSANATCSTSASCTAGSCSHQITCNGVCTCSSSCGSTGVWCRCHCFDIQIEPDFEEDKGDAPHDRNAGGVKFEIGGTINLASLAVVINDADWGVSIAAGDVGELVGSGTYTGTMTEIVEHLGDDNDFSVSWNDTTKVVTLTPN